jgi:SAM-dependent methyltransferase
MLTGKEYFYPYFRESVLNISKEKKVIDIGTSSRFQKELEPYKGFFKLNYFALDYKTEIVPGYGNIDIDASIYALPFKDNFIDAILCLSVFEHLCYPFRAAGEIHRVLKPGGKAFLTIPFIFGEHAKDGDYGDYYRFTEQGIKLVFKDFSVTEIEPQGRGVYYRLFLLPALMKIFYNKPCMKIIKYLDSKTTGKTTTAWMVNLKK